MNEHKLIDLGWCVARLTFNISSGRRACSELTIVRPDDAQERVYTPAASVTIYGESAVRALRDALNEALL